MIIGISGKIGTGKTRLAEELLAIATGWTRVAFGDALKRECSDRLDFPMEWAFSDLGKARRVVVGAGDLGWLGINGPHAVRVTMTVREILQHRGQAARACDPQYWVRQFALATERTGNVICDDVRYPSEADHIRRRGGFLIRLEPYTEWRPGPFAAHESEIALDAYVGWDMQIAPDYGDLSSVAHLIADLVVGLPDTTP